jgi:hypothetical protein
MRHHLAFRFVVLGLAGWAVAGLPGNQPASRPAEDAILTAELRMLRATVKSQFQQIEDLQRQVGELRKELERLRQLCRDAGIDPGAAAPATAPAVKTSGPPGSKRTPSAYGSLAELLRAVPRQLMPPGKARPAQRAELEKWAARELPGSTLTAEITIRLLRSLGAGQTQVVGDLPPAPLHGRVAHCILYATFAPGDAKRVLNLDKGAQVKVSGVLPSVDLDPMGPLRPGSGQLDLELYGHLVGTRELVEGWNEKHAFMDISLRKCRLAP